MYRLATLLTLLIVLAVGCGGSDDDGSKSSPVAAASSAGDGADAPAAKGQKKKEKQETQEKDKDKADSEEKSSDPDDGGAATEEGLKEATAEKIRKLPVDKRTELISTVVRSALLRFGLDVTDVRVTHRGRNVTAIVSRKTACRAIAKDEPNMTLVIKEALPAVKTVRYEVAGSGQELGYYVVDCKKPEMPSGEGRVVLTHTGVGGPWDSPVFTIDTEHWAMEWENQGASMAGIIVPLAKKKKKYYKPISSQKPEAGRFEYTRGGRFRIRVSGAGRWSIRIKEIR